MTERAAPEVVNPRWLCGYGHELPLDGPAYPVCSACGGRARFVTGDNLDAYVGTPAERMERARARYRELFKAWATTRANLRYVLDDLERGPDAWADERFLQRVWSNLATGAAALEFQATELDRVEREVAAA